MENILNILNNFIHQRVIEKKQTKTIYYAAREGLYGFVCVIILRVIVIYTGWRRINRTIYFCCLSSVFQQQNT